MMGTKKFPPLPPLPTLKNPKRKLECVLNLLTLNYVHYNPKTIYYHFRSRLKERKGCMDVNLFTILNKILINKKHATLSSKVFIVKSTLE
jgi:hypothetical protein